MKIDLKNIFSKSLLLIVSLGFSFGIVELYVRYFHPQEVAPIRFVFDSQLGDVSTPNQRGRKIKPGAFDHTYSHNSLGWRASKEYSFEKQAEHRILFLGDSFTYGFGVNDDQTFAFLTEKHLLDEHISVEVINAGCSGKGTDFAVKLFQVWGDKFNPDLTVVCFTANDFIDNERGEYFSVSPDGEITPKVLQRSKGVAKTILYHLPGYNWLISWSQAANLVKEAGVKWFLRNTDPIALKEGGLIVTYPVHQQGYANEENKRLTEVYLRQLLKSVKQSGSSLMIIYVPMYKEVEDYRHQGHRSNDELAILDIAKKLKVTAIPLTPVLAASGKPTDQLYFNNDGHWNASGHALVARYLSEQIRGHFQKP